MGIHADATRRLADCWDPIPQGSIGYRNYYDFTGSPEREEITLRAAVRLRYRISEAWAISGVAAYDRFATDNNAFDAERTQAGIFATYLR